MAQTSFPDPAVSAGALTEREWERNATQYSGDGVYGDPTAAAVVVAGVGLNVTVRAFRSANVHGYEWYSGGTDYTHSISSNASGSTRIDRVVLRLDRANWTVRSVVRQGTPGAGAPALQRDTGDNGLYELPLAQVTVLNNASSVTVAREEMWIGSRLRPCTSTTRPLYPVRGDVAFETDTGKLIVWNGSAWGTVYRDSGQVTLDSPLSAWDNATPSILELRNGSVHVRMGSFTRAAGTLGSGDESRLPLNIPAAYQHPNRDQYVLFYLTGGRIARATIYNGGSSRPGQVWLSQHGGVDTNQSLLGSTVSWAVS